MSRDRAKTGLRKRFWVLHEFGVTCPCCDRMTKRKRGRKDRMWGRLVRRRLHQEDDRKRFRVD